MRKLFPYIALISLSACAADIGDAEEAPAFEEAASIGYNSIGYNSIGYNALTANFEANSVMTQVLLGSESYDASTGYPELKYALHDALTREFMKYLVSCSLDSTQSLYWKDPFDGAAYLFKGSMGHCSDWGNPAVGYADDACRQVVSSCLLSRVNAFGQSVRLSQRGHLSSGQPIELADTVPAGNTYLNGSFVPGLTKKCFSGVTGAARECAWRASETGYCTPGASVTVGLGAPPASACWESPIGDSFGADTVLRVCKDLNGCKATDSTFLGQANNTCSTAYPSVTFTCPTTGFFTTMIGHHVAASTPGYPSWKPGVVGGKFGTESDIFGYQEAAFYGDVFDAGAMAKQIAGANIHVDPDSGEIMGRDQASADPVMGSIYGSMFACWSPTWTEGMAYATHRVCGGPTLENCAALPVGACGDNNTPDPPSPEPPYATSLCAEKDDPLAVGDQDFQFCEDNAGRRWDHAMTVFLNNPCDLVPDPEVCQNIYGIFPPNW